MSFSTEKPISLASSSPRRTLGHAKSEMKQDGYLKVVEGLTTIDEVLRVAQE